jgi:predicted extracellular nuclease
VSLAYDASGHASLTCTVGGGGGGGGGSPTLVINEFSTGVTGAATNEFVELYNAGTSSLDVSGFKVVYRSASGTSDSTLATIPAGTQLAAGAFYLGSARTL